MKRGIVFFVLVSGLCLNLFAADFSVGAGVSLLPYQEGLRLTAPDYKPAQIRNHWVEGGVFAYIDARYVEIEAGHFSALYGDYEWYNFADSDNFETEYDDLDISYFNLGILLKYPLGARGSTFVITPMIGFTYLINLSSAYGYSAAVALDAPKKEWDQMFIKLGLGFDKYFTEKVYLRFTTKLAFPIITDEWKNRGENLEEAFGITIKGLEVDTTGGGIEFTLALGFAIK
jgi:hypothetical protein